IENGIADDLWRVLLVLLDDLLDLFSVLLVGSVVNAVRVKEKYVSLAHQGYFGDVRFLHVSLAELDGRIPALVRVVPGDFESKRRKLRETPGASFDKPPEFRREDKRRRVAEVHEAEEPVRMDLTINHGGELAIVFRASAERVAGGHGSGKPQVDPLEHLRRGGPIVVQFGKHRGMKNVMHSGRDLRRDHSMSLGIHQKHSRRGVQVL